MRSELPGWDECPYERGPTELPCFFFHMRLQLEGAISESNTESANTLIFRTVRNTFLFKAKQNFISHPVSGFCWEQPEWTMAAQNLNYICKFPAL